MGISTVKLGRDEKITTKLGYYLVMPVIMPVAFFLVVTTPIGVLGCRLRGLLALIIALICGISSLATAFLGLKERKSTDIHSFWWVLSSLVLSVPVIFLIILA